MAPRVSVGVPTYNAAPFIHETLASVLRQSYQDLEVIVIDDASADATTSVVQSVQDPRVRLLSNARRLGPVRNAERCLAEGRGEYMALFGHDDVMHPENIARKIALLDANPDVGFVWSRASDIDGATGRRLPGPWSTAEPHGDTTFGVPAGFRWFWARENPVCASTVVARADVWKAIGPHDARLGFTADWRAWLHMAVRFPMAFIDEALVDYRWHEGMLTNRYRGTAEGLWQRFRAKLSVLQTCGDRVASAARLEAKLREAYADEALREAIDAYRLGSSGDTARAFVRTSVRINRSMLRDPRLQSLLPGVFLRPRPAAGSSGDGPASHRIGEQAQPDGDADDDAAV